MRRLIYYPRVETQAQLDDLLARCAWYFHPFLDRIGEVEIAVAPGLAFSGVAPEIFDHEVRPRLAALKSRVRLAPAEADPGVARLAAGDPARDAVLVWRATPEAERSPELAAEIARFRGRGRYFEVDPQSTRMEGSFYLWAGSRLFTDEAAVLEASRARLAAFAESLPTREVAYVFGTGPSLSDFVEGHDFSDGVCFAANSMVDNPELLARLKPRAIVAGDPLFHAGCSRYAGHFRRRLVEAMETTGAWFFTPLRDHHIHAAYLPPHLRERLVAIPFDARKPYNVALDRDLYVNPKANILTLLLLPLAGTFFEEVRVVGCDGRPLEDNAYFWAHDKKAQINHEMDNIKVVHPAFFNIDYNDYYTEHCETVSLAVGALEAAGRRVVGLTPSYVPALSQRYKDPGLEREGPAEFISLDPDALGDFGHFLSYDRRLRDAAQAQGLAFRIYANLALDADACHDAPVVERVFSLHSWTVGNRPCGPRPQDVDTFRRELARALDLRRQRGVRSRCVLYMYCGSLQHMRAVDEVLADHPNVTACINLFWTSFVPYREPAYVARWKPVLAQVMDAGRVLVTVPTPQLRDGLRAAFDLDLPVAPHPSTTFSDEAARALAAAPAPRPSSPPAILFPGGMRPEKGFGVTAEAAIRLHGRAGDRLRLIVRGQATATTPPDMLKARDALAAAGLPTDDSELNDEEFADFLARGDVIVLPYKAPDFSERTSGLLIDALLLGKPSVVLEGTWLADVAREYGVGTIVADDPEALVEGVLRTVEGLTDWARRLEQARPAYLAVNTWAELVRLAVSSAERRRAANAAPARAPAVIRDLPPRASRRGVVLLGEAALPRGFDVEVLHQRPVIVLNGGYRHQKAAGFRTAHYVCLDARNGQKHEPYIRGLLADAEAPDRRLLLRGALIAGRDELWSRRDVLNYDALAEVLPHLSARPMTTPSHAALWAGFLGYRDILLVGVRAAVSGPAAESDATAWSAAQALLARGDARVWNADPDALVPGVQVWPPSLGRAAA